MLKLIFSVKMDSAQCLCTVSMKWQQLCALQLKANNEKEIEMNRFLRRAVVGKFSVAFTLTQP